MEERQRKRLCLSTPKGMLLTLFRGLYLESREDLLQFLALAFRASRLLSLVFSDAENEIEFLLACWASILIGRHPVSLLSYSHRNKSVSVSACNSRAVA
jgi:hypothetical protein